MVRSQLEARGISDPRVLDAMRKVPRHRFVREDMLDRAYDDAALPAGDGQTISQPYIVAAMTELLELRGGEKVLEIGTGSGYQAAILAELAREVYSMDRLRALSDMAAARLASLGYNNVRLLVGDGTMGYPDAAPYERIIVTAGAPSIPQALREQLKEGGIIVIPVGDLHSQTIVRARKTDGRLAEEPHIACVFVPLVGAQGWKE
ncbi:MAG: protein-L-isoaspartate(D-aspartate) O-methyltransferase [Thermodesulfovibrionales bacterium]